MVSLQDYQKVCEERDALLEEVAWLKSELGISENEAAVSALRTHYRLTPCESRVLVALYSARNHFMRRVLLAETVGQPDGGEGLPVLNQWICRIRRKLGKDVLRTRWGGGVSLTPSGVALVARALNGFTFSAAA